MKAVLDLCLCVCLSFGLLASPVEAGDGGMQLSLTALSRPVSPGNRLPSPQFPSTVTRYKTLSGVDFRPVSSAINYTQAGDGNIQLGAAAAGPQFVASLDLPGDSTVTDVTFYFVDNSTSDIQFKVSFFNPVNGDSFDAWNITTFNYPQQATIQAISFSAVGGYPFEIDNSLYAYQLLVNFTALNPAQALYSARITYTEPDVPVPDYDITSIGTDFHPTSGSLEYTSNGMDINATSLCAGCSFIAPLNLPQGSLVTAIDYIVIDNNTTYNLTLQLNRFNLQTGALSTLASASTSGDPENDPQIVTVSGNLITVDNSTYSYVVSIQTFMTSMEHQIVGVRVHYTPGAVTNFQVRSLAGYEFQTDLTNADFENTDGAIFGLGSTAPFTANLDLPDGNVIYNLTLFFKKTSGATGDLTFAVKSYVPSLGTWDMLQSYNTSGIPPGDSLNQLNFVGTIPMIGAMDTSNENLRLEVTPSAEDPHLMLYGAQVEFFSPTETFLPVIQH